jgi:hypothetical protein
MDYDALTRAVMALYDAYLYGITGVYFSMQAPGAHVSPRLLTEFETVTNRLKKTFIAQTRGEIDAFLSAPNAAPDHRVLRDARTAAEGLLDDIERIAGANQRSLVDRLKGKTQQFASMLKTATGGVGLLLQRKLEKPEFKVADASGRMWKAPVLMRTMVRDFGYQNDIEFDLAHMDGDLAMVQYADPNHTNNGLVFSISGKTDGYPSFASIRGSIFHPNATARVVSYVSP